jgi:3-deoxy-D-manno-octulosonic-acid transferase
VVSIRAAWSGRSAAHRLEWAQRRARRLPSIEAGGVWIHGASLGEARLVKLLAEGLRRRRPGLPLAVSAYTESGRAALPEAPVIDAAFFIPLDFRGYVRRTLDVIRPRAIVLVETELWPNLLDEASRRSIPVTVVNGRLSPSRMARYRRLGRLFVPLLSRLAAVGAQSEADASRFRELGVAPETLRVTGNIKYDLPPAPADGARLQRLGPARDRPLVVAGSTAPGEEALVLEAFDRARRRLPELLLVLAPRHVERADEVASLLAASGTATVRFSSGEPVNGSTAVLLVDTIGDLPALYGAARIAFVGGSLVPVGGHNLLEPAAAGVPVLFGPHTDHFAEPAEALLAAGGGRRVRSAPELGDALGEWLGDEPRRREAGEAARAVVEGARGALDRNLELLLEAVGS